MQWHTSIRRMRLSFSSSNSVPAPFYDNCELAHRDRDNCKIPTWGILCRNELSESQMHLVKDSFDSDAPERGQTGQKLSKMINFRILILLSSTQAKIQTVNQPLAYFCNSLAKRWVVQREKREHDF